MPRQPFRRAPTLAPGVEEASPPGVVRAGRSKASRTRRTPKKTERRQPPSAEIAEGVGENERAALELLDAARRLDRASAEFETARDEWHAVIDRIWRASAADTWRRHVA